MSDETILVESPPLREIVELAGRNIELVEVTQTETLVVDQAPSADIVELESQCIEVIEMAIQGPPGPPGASAGETMPYAKRTDFVGENLIYKGEALPGSLESASVWRISRLTIIGDDIIEEWANGTAEFAAAWSERASFAYR